MYNPSLSDFSILFLSGFLWKEKGKMLLSNEVQTRTLLTYFFKNQAVIHFYRHSCASRNPLIPYSSGYRLCRDDSSAYGEIKNLNRHGTVWGEGKSAIDSPASFFYIAVCNSC